MCPESLFGFSSVVDGFHGFAAKADAAVNAFEDGGCFAALAAFGGG